MKPLKKILVERLSEMGMANLPDDVVGTLLVEVHAASEEAVGLYLEKLSPARVGRAFGAAVKLRQTAFLKSKEGQQ